MYTFQKETPIYLQLMEEIKGQIARGTLAPGAKMTSIRELAYFYTVNPNTVQRALYELERDGLINTRRASGKTVTEDTEMIHELRENLAAARLESFLSSMDALGYRRKDTAALLSRALKEQQPSQGGEVMK